MRIEDYRLAEEPDGLEQPLTTVTMTKKSEGKRFTWCETEAGWKGKEGKVIPFANMSEAQLNKYLKLSQHKEMVYSNKSYVFADKIREIEAEAKRRGFNLKSLDAEYHTNNEALKA